MAKLARHPAKRSPVAARTPMDFQIANLPDKKLAFTNRLYVTPEKFREIQSQADPGPKSDGVNIVIGRLVFMVR